MVLKICAPLTDSASKINNTEVDHTTEIEVVTPMYNLIKYRDNFSKTSESLSQCYRNEPALNDNCDFFDFPNDIGNASFKFKNKITSQQETMEQMLNVQKNLDTIKIFE